MAEQDRSLWDAEAVAEGVALLSAALPRGPTGPYQLQAAIAAIHDEAPTAEQTDWVQIVALYDLLRRMIPDNPVVALNHAAAVGMAHGPHAGLTMLDVLEADERVGADRRFPAVRAHLLDAAGDHAAARELYREAARRAPHLAQRRYLHARIARLADPAG